MPWGRDRDDVRRLVLVDLDPYLRIRVERAFPRAEVVAVHDHAGLDEALAGRVSAFLVDADSGLLSRVVVESGDTPVFGVGHGGPVWGADTGHPLTLARALDDEDIPWSIAEAIGLPPAPDPARHDPPAFVLRWLPAARVVAAVLGLAVVLADPALSVGTAVTAAATIAYAAGRVFVLGTGPLGMRLDVLVAALLLVLSGGPESPYVGFALVAVAGLGVTSGTADAFVGGLVIAVPSVPMLVERTMTGAAGAGRVLVFLGELVIAAAGSSALGRIWRGDADLPHLEPLVRTRHALSSVRATARKPRRLAVSAVAQRLLEAASARWPVAAGVLLLEDGGHLREVARLGSGVDPGAAVTVDVDHVASFGTPGDRAGRVPPDRLPRALRQGSGERAWWSIPLRDGGHLDGVLLLSFDDERAPGRRSQLTRFGRRCALDIHNARLFAVIQDLAVDGRRRDLAARLERDLAQTLVHLRFELDLLALGNEELPDIAAQLRRLSSVTQLALDDVRAVIADVEGAVHARGLAAGLHDYATGIRGAAAAVRVHARSATRLAPERESVAFRIACDALDAALRHGDVGGVDVVVEDRPGTLVVEVHDDGRRPGHPEDRRAFSRRRTERELQDRASRAGFAFEAGTDQEGNVARLRCPLPGREPSRQASPTAGGRA